MKMLKFLSVVFLFLTAAPAWSQENKLDTNQIQRLTGLTGKMNTEEGVFKVTSPRADIKVSVDRWTMPPFMGLTSWAAFKTGMKEQAMVMGDLVLFQDEVNSVMTAALENGLNVTALHNHFFYDEPKVYFMHIGGEGTVQTLASGVKAALDAAKRVRAKSSKAASSFGEEISARSSITPEPLQKLLASKGETKDGMFKAVIGRTAKMPCGCEAGKEMGVNTWAAFAGSDDNAVVAGDFAVLENELQPVLKVLRREGINIVAIHHHMINETPRTLFLHYWGRGPAKKLAESVQRALLVQKGVAFNISPADYEQVRGSGAIVIDVCTPEEFAGGHVPGAINLDVNAPDFAERAAKLDKGKPVLVNCHAGIRGARAAAVLNDLGFSNVKNLEGGLAAWEATGNKPVK